MNINSLSSLAVAPVAKAQAASTDGQSRPPQTSAIDLGAARQALQLAEALSSAAEAVLRADDANRQGLVV